MNRQPNAPILAVLLMSSVGVGIILMAQVLTQQDLFFDNRFGLGLDYNDFYTASLMLRTGASPYAAVRYVAPPLAAIVNVPATYFRLETLRYEIPIATFVAVMLSIFLLHRVLLTRRGAKDLEFMAATAAVVMLSYPFYFLFDRGNIDGFVLLVMCLGILALTRADALSGVLFAIAAGLKAYPILVVLPLAARRRWKALAFLTITLAIFVATMPDQWLRFLQSRLLTRGNAFRIDENGSLACTFYYLGGFISGRSPLDPSAPFAELLEGLSVPFYLVLLLAMVVRDATSKPPVAAETLRGSITLYFPFMVAIPRLAYHYELVNLLALLPVVTWSWFRASSTAERRVLAIVIAGIGLSQFHAVAAQRVTGSVYPHFVPGLGLLLVLLGTVWAKWRGVFDVSGVWTASDEVADGADRVTQLAGSGVAAPQMLGRHAPR